MGDVPLVPSPLYGLRTWSAVGEQGSERLAAPHQAVTWPAGGAWLEARCPVGHTPPANGCDCGIHAWHPRKRWARRIMALRGKIPGVVEASGPIELHEDGFRAQRARPYALVVTVGRNPRLVRRRADAYDVPVIEAAGPGALLDWCRARGLGLDEPVVCELMGAAHVEQRRRDRRRRVRNDVLRTAAVFAAVAALLALGLVETGPPDGPLFGRTGWVNPPR
jgi:hypothetical protein